MNHHVKQTILLAILLVLFIPFASARDHVIINSRDWRDVYSGMLYSNLIGSPSNFLVSSKHSTILLYSLPKSKKDIQILTSRRNSFVVGYKAILDQEGYEGVEEDVIEDFNLELARRLNDEITRTNQQEGRQLPPVTKFIIIDDSYGYNAVSVGPFASLGRYYVLFADEGNIDDVVDFLQGTTVDEIIIFGQVDRAVKSALAPFNPEIINVGNRFENNIEIVKRYLQIKPTRQVILTNGEFLEQSLLSGADPVLFIGRENVVDEVKEFISQSDIDIGILIGNELVGAATAVRRQLGISVFVKFAQSARVPGGAVSQVEDLDRFPMPRYDLSLSIASIVYNEATGALEVTYQNNVDLAAYFRSTITITDAEGVKVVGDEEPIFIEANALKTVVYTVQTSGEPLNLQGDDISGRVFTIYGESPGSLERQLDQTFKIERVRVDDSAEIEILDLVYDIRKKQFIVTIENTGSVDAYVNPELVDLRVNGERVTVGADEPFLIKPGKKAHIPISIELSEEDFPDNEEITVRAYYGERKLALVKVKTKVFAFKSRSGYLLLWVSIALIVLVLLIAFFSRKRCKNCGYFNSRRRKTCKRCHHRL
ncbi:hypothetical protein D6783_05825 [Candidatus Woesearchaeota archaeon]|nr:MAG: hypothetical protein D6783_05825 [Candidatus Woesearchaeota archaeon]